MQYRDVKSRYWPKSLAHAATLAVIVGGADRACRIPNCIKAGSSTCSPSAAGRLPGVGRDSFPIRDDADACGARCFDVRQPRCEGADRPREIRQESGQAPQSVRWQFAPIARSCHDAVSIHGNVPCGQRDLPTHRAKELFADRRLRRDRTRRLVADSATVGARQQAKN